MTDVGDLSFAHAEADTTGAMTYGVLTSIIYAIGLGVLAIATVIALARHRKPFLLVLIAMAWIYAAGFVVRLSDYQNRESLARPLVQHQETPAYPTDTVTSDTAVIDTIATNPPTREEDLATIHAAEKIKQGSDSARDRLARIRADAARKRIAATKK